MWRWRKYVPVAQRKAQAKRKIDQLRKKGKVIEPIEIAGRNIAQKFWGKQWCKHLESFSDYENRIPRGRTYVRNGSVCHLVIKKGEVEAIVSGSSLYNVKAKIKPLESSKWKAIKEKCRGQIGSLLELLSGKLSDNIMKVVADHQQGLFPAKHEIDFSCDCPDWADMCKHIAAVLYGIGSRLDEQPNLLFVLRGVDADELITTKLQTSTTETDDLLGDEGLSDIFDIDIDLDKTPTPKKPSKKAPEIMTGPQLQKMRIKMDLTVGEFAKALDVTSASIYRWEKLKGPLNLQNRSARAIAALRDKRG